MEWISVKDRLPDVPENSEREFMAEIERLVDAMMQSFEDVHTYGAPADIARYRAVRAALMAAIRSLSNSAQSGE